MYPMENTGLSDEKGKTRRCKPTILCFGVLDLEILTYLLINGWIILDTAAP
jgi:hypothetical protein